MRRRAFTLVELLVVIGIIALLISVLLPTLSRAKEAANRTKCAANMRELVTGWMAYHIQYKGKLPYVHTSPSPTNDPLNAPNTTPWVTAGNTEADIKNGSLYPFVNNVQVYRCPSDSSFNLRTYSPNNYLNGEFISLPRVAKANQIRGSTADVFVFIEEFDTRGSNLGSFAVDPTPGSDVFIDIPGFFHKGSTLAWADGHVTFWVYADPRTFRLRTNNSSSPNNPDLKDLQRWCGANNR